MTLQERRLLLTTARVLRAQFLDAAEPLEPSDVADYKLLAAALAPFEREPAEETGSETPDDRRLLVTTARIVRDQVRQAARQPSDRPPARALARALAAAVPPLPYDVVERIDRD